jgi:hypothetical protein
MLLAAGILVLASFPLADLASACTNDHCHPPPLVGACVAGVTSEGCHDGHPVCVSVSLEVPFCPDASTVDPCTVVECIPCMRTQCGPPPMDAGPACETLAVGNWAVGASWSNCIHVDAYACVEPRYFGGRGLPGGWVCEGYVALTLP